MKVVVNSSPLISLSLIGQLELLPKLYDEIIVPKSVYNEVVVKGKGKAGSEELGSIHHFTVLETENKVLKDSIMLELDEGEAEVITIAKEKGIQNVIIDEFAGRQYASLLGLNVTGTLGILLIGKNLGFIGEVKPLMDMMLKHNRFINRGLYLAVLKKANEI
jgi:predicted nucleic acid-binding protein